VIRPSARDPIDAPRSRTRARTAVTAVAIGVAALVGGCGSDARRDAVDRPSDASGPITLDLAVHVRPDDVTHEIHVDADGSGTVVTTRVQGYAPVREEPVAIEGGAALSTALAALFDELATLPRFAHTSSTFAGVRTELRVERGDRILECRTFNTGYAPLDRLAAVLRRHGGEAAAAAVEPLRSLEANRGRPAWTYTPGASAPEDLLIPLDPPSPDVELRRLALGILADEGRDAFVPRLRALYRRSDDGIGEPDYFLALALLRCGDPVGLDRVLDVSLSAHPDWAFEAGGALGTLFGEAYGGPVIPPWDFRTGEDPRGAAVEAFRAWHAAHADRLTFDVARRRFVLPEG